MRVAIVGTGRMGSWLARTMAKENEIAVFDLDREKAEAVKEAKTLAGLDELEQFKPHIFINAVSLQHTIQAFKEAEKHLAKDCVLCDVASVKAGLEEYYKSCGYRFASVHPMFGPTFADMDSLREENVIIIKESEPETASFLLKFFASFGLKIYEFTFQEHDRMMAYSLTTPFVSSLVFAACMEKTAVPGTTFARHRKIASGLLSEDNQLLSEILFNPYSLGQLEKITGKLEYLKHIVKGKDNEELVRFLDKLRQNIRGG